MSDDVRITVDLRDVLELLAGNEVRLPTVGVSLVPTLAIQRMAMDIKTRKLRQARKEANHEARR